jgi:hypothetical protein
MSHLAAPTVPAPLHLPVVWFGPMLKKLIAPLVMFAVFSGGCILHTHSRAQGNSGGCGPGWVRHNNGCIKRGSQRNMGHNKDNGGVVVRDHRR